jgi:hypothetical protein
MLLLYTDTVVGDSNTVEWVVTEGYGHPGDWPAQLLNTCYVLLITVLPCW